MAKKLTKTTLDLFDRGEKSFTGTLHRPGTTTYLPNIGSTPEEAAQELIGILPTNITELTLSNRNQNLLLLPEFYHRTTNTLTQLIGSALRQINPRLTINYELREFSP